MSYLNIDRSKVNRDRERPVSKEIFGRGTHEVIIEHAKVKKASKGYDMLEVKYANDTGFRYQWFLFGHPNEKPREIAIQELDDLLLAIEYPNQDVPDVSWYVGKPVKITVYGKDPDDMKVRKTEKSSMLNQQVSSSDFNSNDLEDEIPFG